MNEHSFVASIHRILKKHPVHIWKINDQYAGGVPDAFYEGVNSDLWVEYKYIPKLPKRSTTKIDLTSPKMLSMNQQLWIKRRYEKRKDVAIVVGSPIGHILIRDISQIPDLYLSDFQNNGLSTNELGQEILNLVN